MADNKSFGGSETQDSAHCDPVVLCAGFPHIGDRVLAPEELAALRREGRIATAIGCLTPIAVLALIVLTGIGLEPLVAVLGKETMDIFVGLSVVTAIVVCAIGALRGMETLERARKLRKTRRAGFVRAFHGPFDWYDPTDAALASLLKTRLLIEGVHPTATVELFPHLDEVFGLNGARVKRVVKVTLTYGAPRPADSLVLDFPKAWLEDETDLRVERRRPSDGELSEMRQYAHLPPRYWFRTIGSGVLLALGLFLLMGQMVQFSSLGPPQGKQDTINRELIILVALIASVAAAVVTAYRIRQSVGFTHRICQDIEINWIIAISPPTTEIEVENAVSATIERLPSSSCIWTIGGKPAGWRRYSPRASKPNT